MKKLFLAFFLILVNVSSVLADGGTAANPDTPTTTLDEGTPHPPTPIDENLMFLLVVALLFGIYAIYRYNLKRKASM